MSRTSRCCTFARDEVGVYHAFNRTVRRSYLHGVDPLTGIDYGYRRERFRQRMQFLAQRFCIDVLAFAIIPNHWHCVLRNRPDLVRALSDRQVAVRWLSLTSRKRCQNKLGGEIQGSEITQITSDPSRVAELRLRLSDISWFIRLMCQTIARECNLEDECTGRFFEERFKLKRLEDEPAVLACMAYVDLNPLRAGLADSLDDYSEVSIGERLRTLSGGVPDTSEWLAPLELASEVVAQPLNPVAENSSKTDVGSANRTEILTRLGCLPMALEAYERLLWQLALESRPELQASEMLTKDKLQTPIYLDGKEVNVLELQERHTRYSRRCQTQLGQHACRAVRARLAAQRQVAQQPVSPSVTRTPLSERL